MIFNNKTNIITQNVNNKKHINWINREIRHKQKHLKL